MRLINHIPSRPTAVLLAALPFALVLVAYAIGSHLRLAENPSDKLLPSLGTIGDTRAVEGLARLASDEDSEVRMAAIQAIGAIGSPGSERVLRRLAERSSDEDEIAAIVEALEELEAMDMDRWDQES